MVSRCSWIAPLVGVLMLWLSPCLGEGLPYNARQIEGGYWAGGRPTLPDVSALQEAGITRVVSIVKVKQEVLDALQEAGIKRVRLTFGTRFPTPAKVKKALGDTPPEQVYIHCRYGADRVGVVLAFLLVTRQGWDVPSAFLSVVNTDTSQGDDEAELRALLEEEGYDTSEVEGDVVGMFAPLENGGDGGLKIRSEGYRRMVRNTIARIQH